MRAPRRYKARHPRALALSLSKGSRGMTGQMGRGALRSSLPWVRCARLSPHERFSILVILSYGPLSGKWLSETAAARRRGAMGSALRANTLKVGPFKLLPAASVCGPTFRVFATASSGAAWFLSSEPHGVSGGTNGVGARRTPVTSPRAWVDRHTRAITDILCFRATSQGSFARPVTRVYASAR